jgi:threonine/homoserine/homoserine lactone efflux protein
VRAPAPYAGGVPDTAHLLAFTLAALTLAAIPGPGMLYVLARSLGGGRAVGLRSSFGTALGGCVHVVAAAVGLSALVAASATAFTVVKLVGAGYLVWLGVRALMSAKEPPPAVGAETASDAGAFRQGVLTEALNPKTALFFVTFLPQFCQPENGPIALQVAVLGLISVALNTTADVVIAFAAGPLGRRLGENARWWRRQRRATGGVLIGLGVYAAR